jgi:predicted nuclease of predicted toxin-antitoxin system
MPESTGPRFLADMNISPVTVRDLRAEGWSVTRVSDLLPIDSPDANILDHARHLGIVILTHDLDFSRMLAVGGHSAPSVVNLRLDVPTPANVTARLLEAGTILQALLLEGDVVVTVTDAAIRYRSLPLLTEG